MPVPAHVLVPPERFARWAANFAARHGSTTLARDDGRVRGTAEDGSTFEASLPFGLVYAEELELPAFAEAARAGVPQEWGVLLVRKGGFAVARLAGLAIVASKVGQRHVQGRTKAGGQSQQRFARRRDQQARQAYAAAADHAFRLLGAMTVPVVVGGDRGALEQVLGDARLAGLVVVGPRLAPPDPRRAVLEQAVVDACSIRVEVRNA